MTDLQYPRMREELIGYLEHLADQEYQERVWVRGEYPSADYSDDLTQTFELLEDMGVLETPETRIGSILQDSAEAAGLAGLGTAFHDLFERHGTELTDAEYLATPEWAQVVSRAGLALGSLSGTG